MGHSLSTMKNKHLFMSVKRVEYYVCKKTKNNNLFSIIIMLILLNCIEFTWYKFNLWEGTFQDAITNNYFY